MKSIDIDFGEGIYKINVSCIFCGSDINIAIFGGERPHIGACALAQYSENTDISSINASVSTICALGHRDDILARDIAMKLSKKFKANVVVSVGIHVDNASKSDIEKLISNTNEAIHDLENKITNEMK
ncbi:MAG: proteasome assembly chaperone 4 family protein [Intestinibacter sp.]|uniref:proteasome assembly chaperone 4 family protein n=1 Tax=Intestinibacter sp. TaxID=1965304 RepID=UPI002A80103F|nr:proteasome assembly chaperone 4 family protein [Intestinibacter sp.]MDY4574183.1 proteasome assembly chaperone 4 family protein [Intestinibacter sp.]